jgi:hypothetical protein
MAGDRCADHIACLERAAADPEASDPAVQERLARLIVRQREQCAATLTEAPHA